MRLAHTALFAADLERARTFYTRYFDCTAGALYHNPRTGFRSYFLTFPEGGQLELMAWDEVTPRPEGRFRGLDHIAIHVGSRPAVDALTARLAELGAEALHEAIGQIECGTVTRTAQDHAAHTYAPMLDKSLSPLDFTRPARQLHDQVRGLVPWPSASMVLAGKPVKIHRTAVGEATDAPAGAVVTADKTGLSIACGDGKCLRRLELQGEGGKRMAAADYLRGHPVPLGL